MNRTWLAALVTSMLASAAAQAEAPKAAGGAPRGTKDGLRGQRYCEVLLAQLRLPKVVIDVYNTIGLNECPDEAWKKLDSDALRKEQHVDLVKLNGPRYWTLDAIENSRLLDPTILTFGGISMRKAGVLEMTLAGGEWMGRLYSDVRVRRDTTFRFSAGQRVFELIDPRGRIFDMQSYSLQTHPEQTLDSLASLGGRLQLPTGWTFGTRTLETDLRVNAVDGWATIVRDDFGNTYQLSQRSLARATDAAAPSSTSVPITRSQNER